MPHENKTTKAAILPVAEVAVRVPPFGRGNPVASFRQFEPQFTLASHTMGTARFNHVVIGFDEETIGRLWKTVPTSD